MVTNCELGRCRLFDGLTKNACMNNDYKLLSVMKRVTATWAEEGGYRHPARTYRE